MKRLTIAALVLVLGLLLAGNYITPQVDEDLRFPSSGINPPGAASDPTRSQTTGLLEFATGADRIIAGNFQMPHSWAPGTAITPHIHYLCRTANNGNVSKWRLDYSIANISGVFSAGDYGTYTPGSVIDVPNPNNTQTHAIISLGTITMTGYTESSVVIWKLTRLDAGNADASTIVLLDFDVHFKVEKFGKNI